MKSAVALAFALALVLAAVPITVHAGAQPHMIFGSVGIGRGQTARLNITNIADADSTGAVSCEVTLGFVDGSNQMLLPAVRVVLGGGRSTHVDVSMNRRFVGNPDFRPGQRLGVGNPDFRPGQRLDVRAIVGVSEVAPGGVSEVALGGVSEVALGGVSEAPGPCDSIVGSVEIVDNETGATQAVVSPLVYSGFNPQPDIPGLVGMPIVQ